MTWTLITPDGEALYSPTPIQIPPFVRSYDHLKTVWLSHAPDAKVILDVGANLGTLSWKFHTVYPDALIIAVEPLQENIKYLKKNCPYVEILEVAAHNEQATLAMNYYQDNTGRSRVSEFGATEVQADRLDDLVSHADIIKIDVEDHEGEALEGMPRLISQAKLVMLECRMPEEIIPKHFQGWEFATYSPIDYILVPK